MTIRQGTTVIAGRGGALPSQIGQSGKFLTTDGTNASWMAISGSDVLHISGNENITGTKTSTITTGIAFKSTTAKSQPSPIEGQIQELNARDANDNVISTLGTNITNVGSYTYLTSKAYNADKSLAQTGTISITSTTSGVVTSAPIPTDDTTDSTQIDTVGARNTKLNTLIPSQSGNNGKYLTTNGTTTSWATISVEGDGTTITANSQNKLQANGIIDKKTGNATYDWTGTLAEYEALGTYDNNWTYFITDDVTSGGVLPSQTGHAGQYLTTNGSSASWVTLSALQNTATGNNSLTIAGTATTQDYSTNVGVSSSANGSMATAYGYLANASGSTSIALGRMVYATQSNAIAIGNMAHGYGNSGIAFGVQAEVGSSTTGAIQIGPGTNSNTATLSIGLYNGTTSSNYQLLNSSGNIPPARLSEAIQLVTELPTNPVAGVLYLIAE